MSFLVALWSFALSLSAVSLLGMAMLIVARPIRNIRDKQMARSRTAILAVLTGSDVDDRVLRRHVTRTARLKSLAPIVLEVLAILRGRARTEFIARLTRAGTARALRRCLQYGEAADRQRAVEALVAFAPFESEEALQRAWWDRNSAVRFAAFRASIKIGAPPAFVDLLRLADEAGPSDMALALDVLRRMAARQPQAACSAILHTSLRSTTRIALIEAVATNLDSRSTDVLLATSGDSDPAVRASAVGAMGWHPMPLVFAAIVKAFTDEAWAVRASAAEAARRARLSASEPLLRLLLTDEHWCVRLRALQALAVLRPVLRASDAA